MLAKRWREHGDRDAAQKLITSHLRLAAKIAMGYRGYGMPISEVISEGNVGLMQAVKRFGPDKGFRLIDQLGLIICMPIRSRLAPSSRRYAPPGYHGAPTTVSCSAAKKPPLFPGAGADGAADKRGALLDPGGMHLHSHPARRSRHPGPVET
jgi:Sigma-70 region 2